MFRRSFPVIAVALAVPALSSSVAQDMPKPPTAKKVEQVSTLHGDRRVDEYAWLRDKGDPRVIEYLEQENAYADAVMAPLKPLEQALYDEMLGRIKQTDMSVPYRKNGFLYYTRTEEGKQYAIFCRKADKEGAAEEVLLDGNALAVGHSFWSLGVFEVSDDARYLAYATDTTGYRQYVLEVRDLKTGERLPVRQERVTSAAWAADNATLFFTTEDATTKRSDRLFRVTLAKPGEAVALHHEPDERFSVGVGRSRSEAYLLLEIGSLTSSEVRVLSAKTPDAEWTTVEPRRPDVEYDVDHRGDRFYVRVNDTGRNFRLVTAPVSAPGRANWTEMIPHRPAVMLQGVLLFKDHMVLYEREQALPHVTVRAFADDASHRVAFPEPVYSVYPSGNPEFDTRVLRYAYQSFVTPPSVFDYDMDARKATLLKTQEVLGGYDASRYGSERVEATAPDGTKVPVSIVYRKDVARDGTAPLYLGGYGSYGISTNVGFSSNRVSLLDRGVVIAYAHVRGGGDLGKPWHDQGRMFNKKNTFTDFIAAAEFLLANRYGAKDRLVVEGGSAGGLLMGAIANLRPDLFKAVVLQVPFVDVINTMLDTTLPLTVAEFEEWGNPANKAEYEYIKTYSPYDNIEARAYPAMLVKTSLNDSQVGFHEPAKYVARMRARRTDDHPLVFKTNMGAGHGGASGRFDRLKEVAFDYAFMLWQMGVK
ncbi:MAG: S9 family peptidase [Vicinamibacterales bacterium]|nr:S9 family peptidase [Vicinamibacterales bacterium]